MNRIQKSFLCLLGIFTFSGLFSQASDSFRHWSDGTAWTVSKHRVELGVLTLSRYGLTDKLEISAHPLMMFLMPQVQIKVGWGERSGIRLASEHGILYPTLFMRLVATKGIGGLISPELTIPQTFAIYNRVLVSYEPTKNTLLSAHAGIAFAVNSGSLDKRATIDLPIFYPRFAVFYSQPEFDAGIDFRGKFSQLFGWVFNVNNFILAGTDHNYFLENKGVLTYTSRKENLRVEAGYKLCYGKYPSGAQWHLLPDINLVFGIGK